MPRLNLRADEPTPSGTPTDPAALPPLLARASDAARLCGVSGATFDRLRSAGKIPAPLRLGGSLCWRVAELAAWTEAGCPDRKTWETLRAVKNSNGRP